MQTAKSRNDRRANDSSVIDRGMLVLKNGKSVIWHTQTKEQGQRYPKELVVTITDAKSQKTKFAIDAASKQTEVFRETVFAKSDSVVGVIALRYENVVGLRDLERRELPPRYVCDIVTFDTENTEAKPETKSFDYSSFIKSSEYEPCVKHASVSPNGKQVILWSEGPGLIPYLLSVDNLEHCQPIAIPQDTRLNNLYFLSDTWFCVELINSTNKFAYQLLDINNWCKESKEINFASFATASAITSMALSPNQRWLVAERESGDLEVYQRQSQTLVMQLKSVNKNDACTIYYSGEHFTWATDSSFVMFQNGFQCITIHPTLKQYVERDEAVKPSMYALQANYEILVYCNGGVVSYDKPKMLQSYRFSAGKDGARVLQGQFLGQREASLQPELISSLTSELRSEMLGLYAKYSLLSGSDSKNNAYLVNKLALDYLANLLKNFPERSHSQCVQEVRDNFLDKFAPVDMTSFLGKVEKSERSTSHDFVQRVPDKVNNLQR